MMVFVAHLLIGLALFAGAAFGGILIAQRLCRTIVAFDDGPSNAEPPANLLIAGCAMLGSIVVIRGAPVETIAIAAIVWAALVACWYCDVARGIVPDMFTIVPLAAILLGYGLLEHRYAVIIAAAVPFVPFAAAALLSRGRGMGWGDVKLVALGGAVLGMQEAVFAFGIACMAAFFSGRHRANKARPIAFAPYLAAAIGIGIAWEALPSWRFF